MSLITRDDLDEVEKNIAAMPAQAAAMYAPVLLAWCRALLCEVEHLRAKADAWDEHVRDHKPSALVNRQFHEQRVQLERERAFARGAEAMRNQVLGAIEPYAQTPVESDYAAGRAWTADRITEHVRNLPVPEVTR